MSDSTQSEYDVIVIGGGPAGVTAALRVRELGATVALVERGRLGGTCTNDGCVPTRILAKTARLIRDADQFHEYGLQRHPPKADLARIMQKAREGVEAVQSKKQIGRHLAEMDVSVFAESGNAAFADPNTIALADGRRLTGRKIIICVGGHARRLPILGGDLALTHSDIWNLTELPKTLLVVGGAATGCQIASVMSAYGAQVTLADTAPKLLTTEDILVSQTVIASFQKRNIEVITSVGSLSHLSRLDTGELEAVFQQNGPSKTLSADAVILAVGWPGNVEGLGLDQAGVETEKGYIKVDDALQTSMPHIYAAGDITGRMMLVQAAGEEARAAAENAVLGTSVTAPHRVVPHGGFTDPEYGSVGLTEQQARRQCDCSIATVPYQDLDRAIIDGHREGFCKIIVERASRHILGAHVVGEQAVEVVQVLAAAMAAKLDIEQLAHLEIAYPTFTGIIGIAARQICRDLGLMTVSYEWRNLASERSTEWERSDKVVNT